jgi:uncharacterized BrkB/YihY/UPF0761 family membrane protein
MRKYQSDELMSRLIFIIGVVLVFVFAISVTSLLYALLFVTQPMNQAPNDQAFIEIVKTLTLFLTGALAGFMSSYGINMQKGKEVVTEQTAQVAVDTKSVPEVDHELI